MCLVLLLDPAGANQLKFTSLLCGCGICTYRTKVVNSAMDKINIYIIWHIRIMLRPDERTISSLTASISMFGDFDWSKKTHSLVDTNHIDSSGLVSI